MAGSKGILFLLLIGTFICNMEAADAISSQALTEGANIYKELVKDLKSGVKNLFIADGLTNVAKSLAALNIHMQDQQKKSLDVIIRVNTNCILAIDSAKVVVTKLQNICDLVLVYLGSDKNQDMMNGAIKAFVKEAKTLEAPVGDAITKLTTASSDSVKLDGELTMLDSWANMKKNEILTMTAAEIADARAKAYGSAAVCVAWGPLAFIACPVAYAIASGVTEGKTVKDIEKSFNAGLAEIAKMRTEIKGIGDKTKQL